MKPLLRTTVLGLAWLFLSSTALLTTPAAQASPILTFSTAFGTINTGSPASLGWEFQTGSSPVIVADLDAMLAPFGFSSAEVRLYDSSGKTLASATVTTADPTETEGFTFENNPQTFFTWNSHPISPITLLPNTTYFIAQDVPGGTEAFLLTSTPLTLLDGLQYVGGVAGTSGTNPTSGDNPSQDPAFFGPNFDPGTLPEPSTLSVLLVALVGLAGYHAWQRRRSGLSLALSQCR
jgi:hypothetical protein